MKKKNLLKLIIGVSLVTVMAISIPLMSGCAAPAPTPEPTPTPGEPIPTPEEPTPTPEPAEELPTYNLRMQTIWQAFLTDAQLRPAIERIERASGGQLEIDIYLSNELVADGEVVPALQDGTLDLAHYSQDQIASPIDLIELAGCPPFACDTGPEMNVLLYERGLFELFQEAWDEVDGVTLINMGTYDPTNLITSKPLYSYDDLDGLRLNGGKNVGVVLGEAGVIMVRLPWEELYMAGQTGILDGLAWCGATEGETCKWYEVFPYFLTNPTCGAFEGSIYFSTDTWEALPLHLQELLLIGFDSWNQIRTTWYYSGESYWLANSNFTLTTIPADDWQRVLDLKEPFYDRVRAMSPRAAKAIQIIEDYQAELAGAGYPYRCPE